MIIKQNDQISGGIMAIAGIAPGTCVVRDTASTPGRTRAVAPGATA